MHALYVLGVGPACLPACLPASPPAGPWPSLLVFRGLAGTGQCAICGSVSLFHVIVGVGVLVLWGKRGMDLFIAFLSCSYLSFVVRVFVIVLFSNATRNFVVVLVLRIWSANHLTPLCVDSARALWASSFCFRLQSTLNDQKSNETNGRQRVQLHANTDAVVCCLDEIPQLQLSNCGRDRGSDALVLCATSSSLAPLPPPLPPSRSAPIRSPSGLPSPCFR